MAAKMEVLKRSSAAQRAPRVLLNPSLSLSFQIPASMRPSQPSSANATLHIQQQLEAIRLGSGADTTANSATLTAANGVSAPFNTVAVTGKEAEGEADESDSWEDRSDWSTIPAPQSALPRVLGADRWDDDWEDATTNDLPDEFPVLILNLSRLRDLHFRSESGAPSIAMDTDEQLREFYETVKTTLHLHFSQMTEVLFEQEICLHAHYGTHRAMLGNLHRAYPTHVFALVDYPVEINGLALHEYLHVLESPTLWPSVNYLKDALRKCSRDLEWKFEIALELERLAQQEHDVRTRELQRLHEEIDALTRLRDSFRAKIGGSNQNQYILLRKLDDIEARLLDVLNLYLDEPQLSERETRELLNLADATPSMQMQNVLDMVVAMVFSRLPRDFGAQPTPEAHFGLLLDHHLHVRRLWKKDFGRLPGRVCGADGGGEERLEEEKEEEAVGLVEEVVEDVVVEVKEVEEVIRVESLPHSIEEEDGEEEEETHTPPATVDALDGYGADDSEASDSDSGVAHQVASRPRRRRTTRRASPPAERRGRDGPSEEEEARERELEAFMYGPSSGDSSQDEHRPSPGLFARTGALALLRRAKENEGF